MQSKKYIIGCDDQLDCTLSDWKATGTDDILIPIKVELNEVYGFDFAAIRKLSPENATAFVAWGNNFMNFQRLEIFMEMKKLGFKLPPLISRNSHVPENVTLSENVYINSGVKIGTGVTIGMNATVMPGVVIQSHVKVGDSCFIDSGAILGKQVEVGEHCIIGSLSLFSESVSIGKFSFIDVASIITSNISKSTYFSKLVNARIY